MAEQSIMLENADLAPALFGSFDSNMKLLQNEYGVNVVCRGNELKISGDAGQGSQTVATINSLIALLNHGDRLDEQKIRYTMSLVNEGKQSHIVELTDNCIAITTKGRPVRPLYDALFDMLGAETYQKCLERGTIEVAPLAYMRGRTLDDSFIILDEAQNTTHEQMKMFLTRLGVNSKAVITGDITQIDLPDRKQSGLLEATRILKGIEDLEVIMLNNRDVVRHKMVQRIVQAYERYYEKGRK